MSPNAMSPRGKNLQYKRPKINERDSEEEHNINKVRILNSKYASNVNECIIRSNIRKTSNSDSIKEGRDPKELAFMANFNDTTGNTSFQKENLPVTLYSEGEQILDKEYKNYNGKKMIKSSKIESAFGNCKYRSRIRLTYKDI